MHTHVCVCLCVFLHLVHWKIKYLIKYGVQLKKIVHALMLFDGEKPNKRSKKELIRKQPTGIAQFLPWLFFSRVDIFAGYGTEIK